MAKMFYSLDEAAEKLGKSASEVRAMAERGEVQEFRDGEKLIFKKEQIDLLAGDDGDQSFGGIPLSDSGAGSGIDLAGSDFDLEGPGGGETVGATMGETRPAGISIFDDELDAGDAAAQTQMTDQPLDVASLESFAEGGSALLDFGDTGASDALLGDIYGDQGAPVGGDSGGMFEGAATGGSAPSGSVGSMGGAVLVEPYDGKGSWMVAGIAVGMLVAVLGAATVLLMAGLAVPPAAVAGLFGGNMLIVAAIPAAVMVIFGLLGFFLGK
ncbi:MAG: helix-turn-helix domain-containing protein [Phycisphaerales bacterium]